jgi:hypothetical protein
MHKKGRRETSTDLKASGNKTVSHSSPRGTRRPTLIRDVFQIPTRYQRSIHLERDFYDLHALHDYVVTPTMVGSFQRVLDGLRRGSGRRAWRVTGDFGAGKSSFALVLAHLLQDWDSPHVSRIRKLAGLQHRGAQVPKMVPVLVTGGREGISSAIARAVSRTVDGLRGRGRPSHALEALSRLADDVSTSGDIGALLELLSDLTAFVVGTGRTGVILILDEMGKFLEYAAIHPDREDVYVLQRLAETASRSGDRPLIVLGLLHQGFHAYAERLPSTTRHEWAKVSERLEEIVFDQPLAHTSALVAGALNVQTELLTSAIKRRSKIIAKSTTETGWLWQERSPDDSDSGIRNAGSATLSMYPVHPTLLPVLVRFFARFGQNERSLFSFLLAAEPYGLQRFASREAREDTWFRLHDFYDYVQAVFGHRLSGASYRSQWLRLTAVVDAALDIGTIELNVLKTVALLNVLDVEHLLPTDTVLANCLADGADRHISESIARLKTRGLLYERGASGGYRLWPSSSVNLETAFEAAKTEIGPITSVAPYITEYLDHRPLLARRHAIMSGTLRSFEVRYSEVSSLLDAIARESNADGVLVVALCDTSAQRYEACGIAVSTEAQAHPEVLVAVSVPLQGLVAELSDCRSWQWVAENVADLAHDSFAASEVARQRAQSMQTLQARVSEFIGFRSGHLVGGPHGMEVAWTRGGQQLEMQRGRGLFSALSDACDDLYCDSPKIRNELLNRRTLSSPAAAARMRLIERLFTSADLPLLGMSFDKAPPEKSMYLSVLEAGRVHRKESGHFVIGEPLASDDPLNLLPTLQFVMSVLEEAGGRRVSVDQLFSRLRARPYGVRSGVAPLLLALVICVHAHELALYEKGTFVQRFGPSDFLRLTKAPSSFELQLCKITGVRANVFTRLAEAFAVGVKPRQAELLDVVTPLCVFAANLEEYTRRGATLPPFASQVQLALLNAREPGPLLFHDLPIACGLEAFPPDRPTDDRKVKAFVSALRGAMDELRAAYPSLLGRIRRHTIQALSGTVEASMTERNRAALSERARMVALTAREPRVRTFALRIADTALSEDAWASALGSFILSKPPNRWGHGDESRALDEIDSLAVTFHRIEAIAFSDVSASSLNSIRIGLTRGDGQEALRIVHVRPEDEKNLKSVLERVLAAMPSDPDLRLAALSRVLWDDLRVRESLADGFENSELEPPHRAV